MTEKFAAQANIPQQLRHLPVAHYREDLLAAFPLSIIQAPPGSGKTTFVPPLLAQWVAQRAPEGEKPGRILVTQPRRVAVRAAARTIASLYGEKVGETVGYTIQGERKTSRATRIEILTPGILLRRLQRDPELSTTAAIIFDEVHERHLDSDLALAFALESATLREDLGIVVMSATAEVHKLQELLAQATGRSPRLVDIPAKLHPLTTVYAQPAQGDEALGVISRHGTTGVRREFLAHVARTCQRALQENPEGNVLAFLPGAREVHIVADHLKNSALGVDVYELYGTMPAREQDKALEWPADGAQKRRIIVSTAVAESSLTVPGVHIVVDSGLSREPRVDIARGMSGLVTVLESQASGVQRAGRAARLGPGTAYRCMAESTWARLAEHSTPEIHTADLTNFTLHAGVWAGNVHGIPNLPLIDTPPAPALNAACTNLENLGILHDDGSIPQGHTYTRFPADINITRAMLTTAHSLGITDAAEFGAALTDMPRVPGADFTRWKKHVSPLWSNQADRMAKELRKVMSDAAETPEQPEHPVQPSDSAPPVVAAEKLGMFCAQGYPQRVARKRPGTQRYVLAQGTGAALPPDSPLAGEEWLAVVDLSVIQGSADAMIRAAVPITEDIALAAASHMYRETTEYSFQNRTVKARRKQSLGAIDLHIQENTDIVPEEAYDFLCQGLARGDISLEFTKDAQDVLDRIAFLHRTLGDPWPAMSGEYIARKAEEYFAPLLHAAAEGGKMKPVDAGMVLGLLPWPLSAQVEEWAPARIGIPTGETRAVDYTGDNPTVRLRVQEAFGWKTTPRIADGKVALTLELLSPASRPVAITNDLANFWQGSYLDVRREMRGRYPRHPWPEDGASAEPTRRAKKRRTA